MVDRVHHTWAKLADSIHHIAGCIHAHRQASRNGQCMAGLCSVSGLHQSMSLAILCPAVAPFLALLRKVPTTRTDGSCTALVSCFRKQYSSSHLYQRFSPLMRARSDGSLNCFMLWKNMFPCSSRVSVLAGIHFDPMDLQMSSMSCRGSSCFSWV